MTNRRPTAEGSDSHLRLCANRAGALLLVMTVSQYGLMGATMSLLRWGGVDVDASFWGLPVSAYLCLYLAMYILMMGVPLAVGKHSLCPKLLPHRSHTPLSRAQRRSSVGVGVALCMLANLIASAFTAYLYTQGVSEPSLPSMEDGAFSTLLLDLLVRALAPAVLEEALLRGMVLQLLRPFGDGMAVTVSAVLFGLMHGNIDQAPFALLMGLVLGWLFVYTDRLSLTMAVHGISNALVLILGYALLFCDAEQGTQLQLTVLLIVLVCGILGAVWIGRNPLARRPRRDGGMPLWKRLLQLCRAPFLVAAAVLMTVLLAAQL